MSETPTGGIWLPDASEWDSIFGIGRPSPARAFLNVVTKSPTATLDEISKLAAAMGMTVHLELKPKTAPTAAGEKP